MLKGYAARRHSTSAEAVANRKKVWPTAAVNAYGCWALNILNGEVVFIGEGKADGTVVVTPIEHQNFNGSTESYCVAFEMLRSPIAV